ncbi:MAG: NAD(P)H-binding protein, partial [Actinomycetota bacterium]
LTDPDTLDGLMDGVDIVFSSVGISRQRDGLTFDQVDYACNHTLIQLAEQADVGRFVYVSMHGADQPELRDLAITKAHEKVVAELEASPIEHRVVRPCGYFSDMGALLSMAKRGVAMLVGDGSNRMSPIHGRDLAQICVDTAEGGQIEVEAGGPEVLTQRAAAELAFDVVGKRPRIVVIPMWAARGLVKGVGALSAQFGDLADFIVTAGEVDGVGPPLGTTTLRSYFEELAAADS